MLLHQLHGEKMSNSLLSALIHLLGFVGLGAVGILALRSWLELRRLAMKRSQGDWESSDLFIDAGCDQRSPLE
ncbi:hypothetical protein [Stenotrophomonas maltophilia]|jgi:hypothetical protein|uniref:hypothetical protein n=1 Tax=Stenotrophomonas maltophilia TaxID=40324 RepID=UPI0039C4E3C7